MAGFVRIQTFVQLIKFGGYRQFSVPKPPLLLAAKRYKPMVYHNLNYINGSFRPTRLTVDFLNKRRRRRYILFTLT